MWRAACVHAAACVYCVLCCGAACFDGGRERGIVGKADWGGGCMLC